MATLTAEKMRLLGKLRNVNGHEKIARQQQKKNKFSISFSPTFSSRLKGKKSTIKPKKINPCPKT